MKELKEFIEGEYVVVTKDSSQTNNWEDWCFQVEKDSDSHLYPVMLKSGKINNQEESYSHCLSDCRYATNEEIEMYQKCGHPFNINDLPEKLEEILLTKVL